MKKSNFGLFTTLMLLTISAVSTHAQIFNSLERVEKSTTLVILDDDSTNDYSRSLRYAVNKYWTISKVQFITDSIHKAKYINNPDFTFLGVRKYGSGNYYGATPGYNMKMEQLVVFSYEKYKNKYDERDLAKPPVAGFERMLHTSMLGKAHEHQENLADRYSIVFVVRYLQAYLEEPLKLPFYDDGYGPEANKIMHGKTLVITQEALGKNAQSIEEIKKIYTHDIKIVSQEELKKYIDSKDPKIVFALLGGGKEIGDSTVRLIIDVKSGEILMKVYDPKGGKFTLKDFKNIAKE